MKITVTMELTQENLSKLRALLPDTEIPGQVSMFDSLRKSLSSPRLRLLRPRPLLLRPRLLRPRTSLSRRPTSAPSP